MKQWAEDLGQLRQRVETQADTLSDTFEFLNPGTGSGRFRMRGAFRGRAGTRALLRGRTSR